MTRLVIDWRKRGLFEPRPLAGMAYGLAIVAMLAAMVWQPRHDVGRIPRISQLYATPCAPWDILGARAYWMLVGDCNPML